MKRRGVVFVLMLSVLLLSGCFCKDSKVSFITSEEGIVKALRNNKDSEEYTFEFDSSLKVQTVKCNKEVPNSCKDVKFGRPYVLICLMNKNNNYKLVSSKYVLCNEVSKYTINEKGAKESTRLSFNNEGNSVKEVTFEVSYPKEFLESFIKNFNDDERNKESGLIATYRVDANFLALEE